MRQILGKIRCYAVAIKDLITHGIWVPHIFRDEYEDAIIIATDKSFRVSDNYQHTPDEKVYAPATLIRSKCIHCGKVEYSWVQGKPENVRRFFNECF